MQTYATEKISLSEISPFSFIEYTAPHIAAKINNIHLSVHNIIKKYQAILNRQANFLIIEGIGGLLVPLNHEESIADLAKAFEFPIILVVGLRLGCINHTLLTLESIKMRRMVIAGWVANCIQPKMPYLFEYIQTLSDHIQAPLLGTIPFQYSINPAKISRFLNISSLLKY